MGCYVGICAFSAPIFPCRSSMQLGNKMWGAPHHVDILTCMSYVAFEYADSRELSSVKRMIREGAAVALDSAHVVLSWSPLFPLPFFFSSPSTSFIFVHLGRDETVAREKQASI